MASAKEANKPREFVFPYYGKFVSQFFLSAFGFMIDFCFGYVRIVFGNAKSF